METNEREVNYAEWQTFWDTWALLLLGPTWSEEDDEVVLDNTGNVLGREEITLSENNDITSVRFFVAEQPN